MGTFPIRLAKYVSTITKSQTLDQFHSFRLAKHYLKNA